MPKERSINPAQAQRKAEKAKAVKKGKAEAQARRNEKLSRRNPDRLRKQLDDLKAIESSGGKLTSHEKSLLEGLEKDLRAVQKAREALGDAAPKFGSGTSRGGDGGRGGLGSARGGRGGAILGKRRRDEEESSDSDIPEDVKAIPMPRDTPPPIPKEVLDRWYQARRERNNYNKGENAGRGTNANMTPLGQNDRRGAHLDGLPERPGSGPGSEVPKVEAKIVYEAKPVVRDLRKEAVAFVPAAVRLKMDKGKGVGGLLEPEEADRLEREGYLGTSRFEERSGSARRGLDGERDTIQSGSRGVTLEEVEDEDG